MFSGRVVDLWVVGVCFRGLSTKLGRRDAPNRKEAERVVTFAYAYVIYPHYEQFNYRRHCEFRLRKRIYQLRSVVNRLSGAHVMLYSCTGSLSNRRQNGF